MAAVDDGEAKALNTAAHDLRMDVLVEVHDERELDRALVERGSSASTIAICMTSKWRLM